MRPRLCIRSDPGASVPRSPPASLSRCGPLRDAAAAVPVSAAQPVCPWCGGDRDAGPLCARGTARPPSGPASGRGPRDDAGPGQGASARTLP
nr:hypothetical protein [Human alphaherpesvirus 2]QBH78577.1 hypothetical protein [Human alphaherpesvirus 2]QBH80186.1 hypothetical protein [Human alphaherpesvirus 2]QBH80197.1 hypothetical protein [Human alphaherpesvirus 2]QBH86013.1 hypothetical protein [Human alphaherpesvirus 2]